MELWRKRLQEAMTELTKYGKYLLNDHANIFLFFIFVGGAVLYQKWLASLQDTFPWALIVCLLLALILNYHPFFSLLKRGDLSFLTPREGTDELKHFFRQAQVISLVIQMLIVFAVFFVSLPLIAHFTDYQMGDWLQISFVLIGLKVWSFFLHQYRAQMIYLGKKIGGVIPFLTFIGSFSVLYCTFAFGLREIVWGLLFILLGLTFFFVYSRKSHIVPWVYWVEKEENRWGLFYRLASQVTTVPSLPVKIRKRAYAEFLLPKKKENDMQRFQYEFSRSWLRMSDYFPIFYRLLIIFYLVVFYFQMREGAWILGTVLILMYGLQILPIFQIHRQDLWETLLPLDPSIRKASFVSFVQGKLLLFSFCLSGGLFLFTFDFVALLGSILLFPIISILFAKLYVTNKL